jgi:hypothetical protein
MSSSLGTENKKIESGFKTVFIQQEFSRIIKHHVT